MTGAKFSLREDKRLKSKIIENRFTSGRTGYFRSINQTNGGWAQRKMRDVAWRSRRANTHVRSPCQILLSAHIITLVKRKYIKSSIIYIFLFSRIWNVSRPAWLKVGRVTHTWRRESREYRGYRLSSLLCRFHKANNLRGYQRDCKYLPSIMLLRIPRGSDHKWRFAVTRVKGWSALSRVDAHVGRNVGWYKKKKKKRIRERSNIAFAWNDIPRYWGEITLFENSRLAGDGSFSSIRHVH